MMNVLRAMMRTALTPLGIAVFFGVYATHAGVVIALSFVGALSATGLALSALAYLAIPVILVAVRKYATSPVSASELREGSAQRPARADASPQS